MAENYKNIENLNKLTADRVPELKKKLDATERAVADLLKKLGSVEAAIQTRKAVAAEEAERAARVAEASSASAASSAPATSAAPAASAEPTASAASAAKESVETSGKTASAARAEETAAPIASAEQKAAGGIKENKITPAAGTDTATSTAPTEKKSADGKNIRPDAGASAAAQSQTAARSAERETRENAPRAERPASPETRSSSAPVRGGEYRPAARAEGGQSSSRSPRSAQSGEYRPRDDRRAAPIRDGRTYGPGAPSASGRPSRPQGAGAPRLDRGGNAPARAGMPRSEGGFGTRGGMSRPAAPATLPQTKAKSAPAPKKKAFDKTYVEKKPINKRAMSRQEGLSVDDFDEEKTGYRKARFGKKEKKKEINVIKIDHAVVTTQEIPLKVLSEKLGVTAVEITKRLFKEGIMKSVNESVDYETAALMAADMGIELEYKPAKTAEEELIEMHGKDSESENTVPRAPIVTVMGHVDHGKTSLLDKIRKTSVTAGEAGGITQSIGAYTVSVSGKQITFIDTPGHAAFTAMRARGAKITDIVVLVVAADDGIMPQTVEAIHHAKAAEVPIIVAINKIDKPNIDINRVKNGLVEHELVPEEWGGDTILVPVSAKTGEGIDNLLETISLVAEMQELRANPDHSGRGSVIEAKLDKGKGPMASVIVQNGTFHTGDNIISGMTMGRIRAMFNDKGMQVKEAGPSMAVSILGLEEVPNAGDSIFAVDQSLMKHLQEERRNKQREEMIKQQSRVSLDDMFAQMEEGKLKTLNLIVKADVQGSVEAIKMSLEKLTNEEVRLKVIHGAAGAISESDVMLAESANAIIIGFNVRPDAKAKALAEKSKVDVRQYRIIYELLDDMEAAMKGMLAPKYQEIYMGKCEVKQTFNITGVGMVAGCLVTEGKLVRGGKLRIYRDNVMIVEGGVKQLKHFKDDVKEVTSGMECGCSIEGFNEIRVGDVIECYLIEEVKRA